MNRSAIGAKTRARNNQEQQQARVLEDAFRVCGLDWWHNTITDKWTRAGWPDYTVFGVGWHAWLELKASNPETGARGKLMPEQRRWAETIEAGGGEWVTFCLPDDLDELYAWLYVKTGKRMREKGT